MTVKASGCSFALFAIGAALGLGLARSVATQLVLG